MKYEEIISQIITNKKLEEKKQQSWEVVSFPQLSAELSAAQAALLGTLHNSAHLPAQLTFKTGETKTSDEQQWYMHRDEYHSIM